ncbi:MAG: polysaccharide deacetylase family protein [Candidatus Sulfotelmatobacter sp.]
MGSQTSLLENVGRVKTPTSKFACLTYHVIGDRTDQYSVTEQEARKHLGFLRGLEFVVDGFEQLESRLLQNGSWPSRYVVLTFDDGHESAIRAADLLEEYEFKATFFLTRDRSHGQPGFIRTRHIQELRRRGFSIGTHGTSHHKLTFMSSEACIRELSESKEWLEDVVGEQVRYMAAPGGFINSRVSNMARERGYVLIGTCREWMNHTGKMALPCEVSRVNVRRQFSAAIFRRAVTGRIGFYLSRQLRAAALAIPKQLLRD